MQDPSQVSQLFTYKSLEGSINFTFFGSIRMPVHIVQALYTICFNPFLPITPEHLSYLWQIIEIWILVHPVQAFSDRTLDHLYTRSGQNRPKKPPPSATLGAKKRNRWSSLNVSGQIRPQILTLKKGYWLFLPYISGSSLHMTLIKKIMFSRYTRLVVQKSITGHRNKMLIYKTLKPLRSYSAGKSYKKRVNVL